MNQISIQGQFKEYCKIGGRKITYRTFPQRVFKLQNYQIQRQQHDTICLTKIESDAFDEWFAIDKAKRFIENRFKNEIFLELNSIDENYVRFESID